jgi:hypothetical protein
MLPTEAAQGSRALVVKNPVTEEQRKHNRRVEIVFKQSSTRMPDTIRVCLKKCRDKLLQCKQRGTCPTSSALLYMPLALRTAKSFIKSGNRTQNLWNRSRFTGHQTYPSESQANRM